MMKTTLFSLFTFCLFSVLSAQPLFPPAFDGGVVDDYFGDKVPDPYQWMEDPTDLRTIAWLEEQSKVSNKFLTKAAYQNNCFDRIDKYADTPFKFKYLERDRYYAVYYDDIHGTQWIGYSSRFDGNVTKLISARQIPGRDNIGFTSFQPSANGDWFAFSYARNGSDLQEIRVVNHRTGSLNKLHIENAVSGPTWCGDGFYYARDPNRGSDGPQRGPEICYHKMKTDASEDVVIFKRKNPLIAFSLMVPLDEKHLLVREWDPNKDLNNLFYMSFEEEQPSLKPQLMRFGSDTKVVGIYSDWVYLEISGDLGNYALVRMKLGSPDIISVIPEYENSVLEQVQVLENGIISVHIQDGVSILSSFTFDGKLRGRLELPLGSSVNRLNFFGSEEIIFGMEMPYIPPVIYRMDVNTMERHILDRTSISFDYEQFESKWITYTADDGVEIPMLLCYSKGYDADKPRPVLLEAYGGYGLISYPGFDPGMVYLMEKGAVFAYAFIRGSGINGQGWWAAGRFENKPRCINDFIQAAEYLIDEGLTTNRQLAITGSSHGGLVVGSAMVKRPDLFAAAVPIVGVFDMLRFHKYTVGPYNRAEFGSAEYEGEYQILKSYSPYHLVESNVNYPPSLIISYAGDDRVPPFHSLKFAAALQMNGAQVNPILLKVDSGAGHSGESGLFQEVLTSAEIYGFISVYILK